jgi:RNA recognition motif-containing protein
MDLPLPYERPDGRSEMSRGVGRGSGEPGRRIYVGNLSWQTSWQELKDHFKQAGEVLYADVLTSSDGRSRGCGVVEFATADQVQSPLFSKIFSATEAELTRPLPGPRSYSLDA